MVNGPPIKLGISRKKTVANLSMEQILFLVKVQRIVLDPLRAQLTLMGPDRELHLPIRLIGDGIGNVDCIFHKGVANPQFKIKGI